ncbi:MAG: hypothetical protein QOG71_1108 [Pyrinomonadaceae bacterium]|nr:hypothetical protein [Pyrinomonadaceae bacterium]
MHDCRQTQDSLIDLLFDEADGAARTRLLAEVGRCAACETEYRSLAATLDACGEASAALAPRENYWPQYHAALTRRLRGAAASGDAHAGSATDDSQAVRVTPAHAPLSHAPLWKRLLTTSIRVPAPLAAAAALLLVATSVATVALVARPAPEPVVVAAPHAMQTEAAPQIKFVEVPVVEEKIVTQIIYLPRRVDGSSDNARQLATRENLAGVRRQNAPPAANTSAATPRANLSGFKPAGEVNLRIIKGSDAREQ